MKHTLYAKAFILMSSAAILSCCTKKDADKKQPSSDAPVFRASIAEKITPSVKTTLREDLAVLWEDSDMVKINDALYQAAPDEEDPTKATLTYISGDAPSPGDELFAYYPASINESGTPTLPSTQYYEEGKISNNPMYAYSEDGQTLAFANICGLLEIALKGTVSVKSIKVSADKDLSGEFNIVDGSAVLIDAGSGKNGVTLDCGEEGVELNDENYTLFYIAVPPQTYQNLKIEVETTDEGFWEKTATKDATVFRNKIHTLHFQPTLFTYYIDIIIEDVAYEQGWSTGSRKSFEYKGVSVETSGNATYTNLGRWNVAVGPKKTTEVTLSVEGTMTDVSSDPECDFEISSEGFQATVTLSETTSFASFAVIYEK